MLAWKQTPPACRLTLASSPSQALRASSPKGRALGSAAKFPGRPQSLRVRLLPLGGAVARSAAEGVIRARTPSVIATRCHLPHGGRLWQCGKVSGQTTTLPVSPKAPPSGELANPQGLTERVSPLPFFQSLRPCSTWNNFTVRRLRWECALYTRYTRPSLPDGR